METMEATERKESGTDAGTGGLWPAFRARILAADIAAFRFFASLSLPKAVSLPLILLVRVGDGWMWGLVALALWLSRPLPQVGHIVLHGLIAIGISLLFYLPIKRLTKRPRPHESDLGIVPLVPPLDKYSFPSGHTMNNLAVALVLSLYYPAWTLPALVFPLLLGTLRVFFGVHYLSDIVGGGILGICAFILAKAAFPSAGF